MPERENRKKIAAGDRAKWKQSDKAVQAEMKNKMATSRLSLQKKVFDRQCTSTQWFIEKEKRQAASAMRKMKHTTGVSQEGVAPQWPGDNTHEKSPYFKNALTLSEKRLQAWRASERQLERALLQEQVELLPWEKGQGEEAKESFGKMMRLLGYDVDDDAVVKAESRRKSVARPQSAKSTASVTSKEKDKAVVDVFQCLKITDEKSDDPGGNPNTSQEKSYNSACNGHTTQVKPVLSNVTPNPEKANLLKTPKFSAKNWEKQFIKDYLSTISAPVKIGKVSRRMRAQSASAILKRHGSDSRPSSAKSSPNKSSLKQAWGDDDLETCVQRQSSTSSSSSAVGKEVRNSHVRPRPHTSHGVRATTPRSRPNSAVNRGSKMDKVVTASPPNDGPRLSADTHVEVEDLSDTCHSSQHDTDEDEVFELSNNQRSVPSKESLATLRNAKVATNGTSSHVAPARTKKSSSSSNATSRRSSKVSFANNIKDKSKDAGKKPQRSFAANHKRRHTLANLALEGPLLRNKTINIIAQDEHAPSPEQMEGLRRRESAPGGVDLVEEEGIAEPEEEPSYMYEFENRQTPRWKRDLMVEAPPGLYTNREPVRVNLVMSRAQRRRELNKMVDDNRSDAKVINHMERGRRLSNRLNVFLTMSTLDEAVTAVTSGPGTVVND